MSYDPNDRFIEPFDGFMIDEQIEAARRMCEDEESDFFVTGGAGTGKSYLIRALRSILPISVCSTTAMSAINVGGITVDRMFNFSRDDWKTRSKSKLDEIMRSVAPNILIDEASQVGYKMAGPIYDAARRYHKRLIIVGDMAQAAPVKDEWGVQHPLFQEAKRIKLLHCHRQSDSTYLNALNLVRGGHVDDSVRKVFAQCVDPSTNVSDDFIRLFATNEAADSYNGNRFNKLPSTTPTVKLLGDLLDMRSNTTYEISDSEIKRAFEGARIANNEWMMIGARVLLGVNDLGGLYVNGDSGLVTEIMSGKGERLSEMRLDQLSCRRIESIIVRLDRTGEEIPVTRIDRVVLDHAKRPQYNLTGFPVKLGWAHTIHKAQGMTLQHAYVSLSSIVNGFRAGSRHGIAYVGLSRTTSLDGLRIDAWHDDAIFSDPIVKGFL